jgi:hypothetical protein
MSLAMPVSGVSTRGGENEPSGVDSAVGGGDGGSEQHMLGGGVAVPVALGREVGVGWSLRVGAGVSVGGCEGAELGVGVVLPQAIARAAVSATKSRLSLLSVSSKPPERQRPHGTLTCRCRLSP